MKQNWIKEQEAANTEIEELIVDNYYLQRQIKEKKKKNTDKLNDEEKTEIENEIQSITDKMQGKKNKILLLRRHTH